MDKKKLSFKLLRITTEQFAFLGDPPTSKDKIHLNTSIKFGLVKNESILGIFVNFKFNCSDTPFLLIEGGCRFRINSADWQSFMQPKEDSIKIPRSFAIHLLMITVGAIRGILHSKTENTPFNEFFVPLIDVTKMINSDVTISLHQDQNV